MSTVELAVLLEFALLAWLGVLAAVVAVKILRGDVNTHGLLTTSQGGALDPERAALMVATLAVAGYYMIQTLGTPLADLYDEAVGGYVLPDLPTELLVLIGGSQAGYLTGKFIRKPNGTEP